MDSPASAPIGERDIATRGVLVRQVNFSAS